MQLLFTDFRQVFTVILALFSVISTPGSRRRATRHLNVILLTSCSVYAYRDVWPLATFNQAPKDASQGLFLWIKIALITVLAAIIPLVTPRQANSKVSQSPIIFAWALSDFLAVS